MLYIVRGLPGSGKTTYAKSLGIPNHFEADDYFYAPNGGYFFDPRYIKEAHAHCKKRTELALAYDGNVVVANTFTTVWELRPYIDLAAKYGCDVILHTCTGNYGSVHGVPEHTIQRMRDRFVSDYDAYRHFNLTEQK